MTPKQEARLAYRAEVKAAVATIADEYVAIFGTTKPLGGDTDARRKKLVFELNRNGQYLSLKEKIKVRRSSFADAKGMKTFRSGDGVFRGSCVCAHAVSS